MNNYILPCDVTSSCGTIQNGLICITCHHLHYQKHIHFFLLVESVFVSIFNQKHNFLQICTEHACQSDTEEGYSSRKLVHNFNHVLLQRAYYKIISTNLYYLSKWHKTELHFWCDLSRDFSYSFCRAETVHDNHQCCHWGNLMHIDVIFQYCIILEIIICRSLETLFVSWFHNSFFLSVSMTVDEKHFLSNL